MLSHPVPGKILVCGFVIITLVAMLAPPANSQTTWTIEISLQNGSLTPTYKITSAGTPTCATTNPPPNPAPGDVYICSGDTVKWHLVDAGTHRWLTIHLPSKVLMKPAGSPCEWFNAKQGHSDGGSSDPNAEDSTNKYSVAVFDDDSISHSPNPRLLIDDPKIIIGTGGGSSMKGKKKKAK